MRTLTKSALAFLTATVMLSSCSRQTAYFQRSQHENFNTTTAQVAAPAAEAAPVAVAEAATVAEPVAAQPSVAQAEAPVQSLRQAVDKYEAVAMADNKLTNVQKAKVSKRLAQAKSMLTVLEQRTATATTAPSAPHKASFAERMIAKKVDKQIKKHMNPNDTQASGRSLLRIGIVVGLIGLLLLLIGNGFGATLGLIALIAGIVLVIIGLLNP